MMKTTAVTFDSSGTECSGTLYADAETGVAPAVVLCPGFSGTQDTPALVAAARAFANAGYAAMTFDYRRFGTSAGEPRQVADLEEQLDDIRAAVAFARAHPGIDPDRIVLWGTSLGGGHVVTVAAGDARIAAVVAQVPFNGFPRRAEGRSTRATLALLAVMVSDWLRGTFGLRPRYIPAVGLPGELAVMTGPQAHGTIAAMDSKTWRNSIAPRVLLQMMRYRPGRHAPDLRMPLLVCIAEHDRETVASGTTELADRAPHAELRSYPLSHFEIYHPEHRDEILADQVDFLKRVLVTS
ncbi:alpha/beta fold hydrolase [Nocardia sp. CC201C]|uniref:alpha/beta hydrolase n=1 Tax=Nocardia sp. CC201C TaxID=3044575 RepID=UPI0024A84C86|nr:alpha/beta fold hydrolase [Nocardia sp. CC201C]